MLVSNHTEYSGYSEEIYDGYKRESRYLTMHDGVKLAIDIYHPTKGGTVHTEPLPVIWCATQYRRGMNYPDGTCTTLEQNLWFAPPGIDKIMRHGYIVAALDVRGSGASFGQRALSNTMNDMYDLYDVNEWLGTQPWCTGKVGMFGCSFLGNSQIMTALMAPPHLTCIVPNVMPMEVPYLITNGVVNTGWMGRLDDALYIKNVVEPAWPVDEDPDGILLAQAVEEHKKNPSSVKERFGTPYFDSYLPSWNDKSYLEAYFPNYIYKLNSSKIAVYIWGAWGDFFAHDVFNWYKTLTTPKKLQVGPWYHTGSLSAKDPDWTVEHLRWYDYWLKGIDNGIMDEPPVRLFNMEVTVPIDFDPSKPDYNLSVRNDPPYCQGGKWEEFYQFPVPNTKVKKFYLAEGRANAVKSVNDGVLNQIEPIGSAGRDLYTVDYSVTKKGLMDRNFYTVPGDRDYTVFDEKSLTYTTAPMAKDIVITGFPVMHLWVKSPVKCLDFYATLEDIDVDGKSYPISEGKLRSAIRGIVEPPYDNMGLPFHRNCMGDQQDMPIDEPVELPFALMPLSATIKAGHRIRLTLNNCDKDNWDTPELTPAPTITVLRNHEHASYIEIPVIG